MVDKPKGVKVTLDGISSRERLFANVRTALRRAASQPLDQVAPLAALSLPVPRSDRNLYTHLFVQNFETLAGKAFVVPDVSAVVPALGPLLDGKQVVASNSPYLETCGITALPQVRSGITDRAELRQACATAGIGITSVEYALAETGTFVMLSSPREARLISLLPPVHIAVFSRSRILANLNELLSVVPNPAEQTSSMVLITGPSRTADIEQILVRGVHGPGEIYAVIVEEKNQ
jgi:L-lactate dehydrogenase complex protein LldG